MTVTVHQRCPLTVRIPGGRGEECVIYTMSVLYLGIRLHLKHQNPVAEKKGGVRAGRTGSHDHETCGLPQKMYF